MSYEELGGLCGVGCPIDTSRKMLHVFRKERILKWCSLHSCSSLLALSLTLTLYVIGEAQEKALLERAGVQAMGAYFQ